MSYPTYGVVNCTTTECERTTWEGETVKKGAWYDAELFKIGSLAVTAKEVGGVSGIVAVLITIGVMCCCFTCYKKRDDIEEGVRRASTVIMRAGSRLRQSIVGRGVGDPNEPEEPADPEKLTKDVRRRQFLKDMFAFHNTVAPEPQRERNDTVEPIKVDELASNGGSLPAIEMRKADSGFLRALDEMNVGEDPIGSHTIRTMSFGQRRRQTEAQIAEMSPERQEEFK